MKVLFIFVVAVSSVSSLESGPYLPSGWRPSGPAFLLPSEVRTAPEPIATTLEPKTPETIALSSEPTSPELNMPESSEINSLEVKILESPSELTNSEERTTESVSLPVEPIQDINLENEASGSDFRREYGPPAVLDIHQSITVQGLPDIVTEHTFRVDDAKISQEELVSLKTIEEVTATISSIEPKSNDEEEETDAIIEAKSSQAASATEAVTGKDISEDTTAKFMENIAEQKTTTSSQPETERTSKFEENSGSFEKSSNSEAEVTEVYSLEYLPPVSNKELIQDNDAIAKEDAVKLEVSLNPLESREESDAVVKSEVIECERSGLEQVPDVLDEQERVGFREYGPPKSKNYKKSEAERIENNESRIRRFSSRFASFKRH